MSVKERGVSSLVFFLILAIVVVAVAGGYLTFVKGSEGSENTPTEDNSTLQPAGGEIEGEENLTSLLLHLVKFPRMQRELSFYPGKLPDNLPVDVPFPENAQLIGSVGYGPEGGFQIITRVAAKREAVIEFYRDQLTEAGWVEKSEEWSGTGGGFTSDFGPDALFSRYENRGLVLSINIYTPENGVPLDVRLELENDHPVLQEDRPTRPRGPEVLPELEPPEGVHQVGGGGGSHSGEYSSESSEAVLDTGMDLEELEAHYNDQLLEAGWNLQEEVAIENLVLRSYTFTDNKGNLWSGTLSIRTVGEEKRLAFLRAYTTS